MFKRKLTALEYHSPDALIWTDPEEYKAVVIWLEDRKIRYYNSKERRRLRNCDKQTWNDAFRKYLNDLECPHKIDDKKAVLDWLLSHALILISKYDSSDVDDNIFKEGINSMARMLQISCHPNHLITFKAICKFVAERLDPKKLKNPVAHVKGAAAFPIAKAQLGLNLEDPALNLASKVLHLLYLHDLRELQSSINECIVAVQEKTANPKTDASLGKVGTF